MPTVLESINASLHAVMVKDESVIIMGEDILDPYGGAFKVTSGLSTTFPERVITTPISEAGIVGIAAGMAMRGLRPVVEIMFGDFITLIADQLVNHIAKFRWMYNDQVNVPIVIRTPMGGRRGYGPTHSQSLEKLYLGIPGIRILSPSTFSDPGNLLAQAILEDDNPVLFIENKLLYFHKLRSDGLINEFEIRNYIMDIPGENQLQPINYAPTHTLKLADAPSPQLTIGAYGYMAELVIEASLKLAYEEELFTEVVIPTQLAPYQMEPILDSVRKTQRLVVVEEGGKTLGWGAEIVARTAENLGKHLEFADRVAGIDLPIPASGQQEEFVLPKVQDIINAVRKSISQY
jgi:pyruvate/2-oxoglutarate/acetoin dehydrogenase E1 component